MKELGNALSPPLFLTSISIKKYEKHLLSSEERDHKHIFSLINLPLDQVFDFLF